MLIVVVIDDVILVFPNDVHRAEDVKCIIHAPLHVLEIDFLPDLTWLRAVTYIAEVFVHLKNFVGNLRASNHRSLADLLQNRL